MKAGGNRRKERGREEKREGVQEEDQGKVGVGEGAKAAQVTYRPSQVM